MENKILTEFSESFSELLNFHLEVEELSVFFSPVIEIGVFPFC